MAEKKVINLTIQNTEDIIFEGFVDRIASYNEMGPFDIYPMHANFISILNGGLSIYMDRKKLKDFDFEQAVLKAKKDTVNIFIGIEVLLLSA